MRRRQVLITWSSLLAILLIAALLRLAGLAGTPPGMPFDEITRAEDALNYPNTSLWPWLPVDHNSLLTAIMSGSLTLFGPNLLAVRLPAVMCGMLAIALTYLWARRVYGPGVGWTASAFMAVSFWPLFLSRIGLDAVLPPLLAALASWLLSLAFEKKRPWLFVVAAASFGVMMLATGWLSIAILLLGFWGCLLIARRGALSPVAPHVLFWAVVAIVAVPLINVFVAGVNSPPFQEAKSPLYHLLTGDFSPVFDAAGRAVLIWTHHGDALFHYNVGEWPVFNIALAAMFVIGLIAAPARTGSRGRVMHPLTPLWLAAGLIQATLTGPDRGFLQASMALPATYVTLALGFDLIGRLIAERSRSLRWQPALMAAIVVAAGVEGGWSYFARGPNDQRAQQDYHTGFFRVAQLLQSDQRSGGVAIAMDAPDQLAPRLFSFVPRGRSPVHWFDGRAAVVAPAGSAPALLIVPAVAPLDQRFRSLLLDRLPVSTSSPPGDDATAIYSIPPGQALLDQFPPPTRQGVWVSDVAAFPPDDPGGVRKGITLPVAFGDVIDLVGYRSPLQRQTGKNLPLTLYWRVERAVVPGESLSIFAHLLTPDGQLAAQRDLLAVPVFAWRPGDVFIQLQDISLEGVAAGKYHLQIGVYHIDSGVRLPVMVGGVAAGDRLLLEPVEITP